MALVYILTDLGRRLLPIQVQANTLINGVLLSIPSLIIQCNNIWFKMIIKNCVKLLPFCPGFGVVRKPTLLYIPTTTLRKMA